MPISNVIIMIIAFLFGLYEIGYGVYAWRLNGFKFYIIAGFLIGSPFLVIGTIEIFQPGQTFQSWESLIFLLWLFGVTWKAWRKRIAKRAHPVEWTKWETILNANRSEMK